VAFVSGTVQFSLRCWRWEASSVRATGIATHAFPAASHESGPHLSGRVEKILASELLNLPKPTQKRIANVAVSVPLPGATVWAAIASSSSSPSRASPARVEQITDHAAAPLLSSASA
jgi:hypothetical protein